MPLLADKIAFAERHIKTKEGVRWSLKGREWVRDEFWMPADGFKLWRHPERDPCGECSARIGEFVEDPSDNPTRGCECGGLVSEPVLVTVLNLERGDGKTFNMMAYVEATLFRGRNKSIAALWASEDQGTQIFEEIWREAIRQAPALAKRCEIFGTPPQIYVPSTRSRMEVLAASHRSATGRRRTHIIADEARDIEARTMMALLPSTNAMHGIECPGGHVQLTPEDVEQASGKIPDTCSACGKRLLEWWPRIILASASGILGGTERDWLYELVNELLETPHPNYHLFTSEKWGRPLNPRKSAKVSGAIEEVFGKLQSTKSYVAAEYGNKWTTKGEDVLTPNDVKLVMDRTLHNEEGSGNLAVGFLDTSTTVEKTSLVLLCDNPKRSTHPFEHVYLSYLEFWWPGRDKAKRKVDPEEVKRALETVLPLYPRLVAFEVDTKAGAKVEPEYHWPTIMVREIRQGHGEWRRLVKPWSGGVEGSDIGLDLLVERVLDSTILLQVSPEILEEVKGLTVSRPRRGDVKPKIVDRNRSVMHKDIFQSLANACWLAKRWQMKNRRQQSMGDVLRRTHAVTSETSQATSAASRIEQIRTGQSLTSGLSRGPESY